MLKGGSLRAADRAPEKSVDKNDLLCYDMQEINLKESEVSMMEVMKNEIAIAYSVKTSVCAY